VVPAPKQETCSGPERKPAETDGEAKRAEVYDMNKVMNDMNSRGSLEPQTAPTRPGGNEALYERRGDSHDMDKISLSICCILRILARRFGRGIWETSAYTIVAGLNLELEER
jgi:hypothetical protein